MLDEENVQVRTPPYQLEEINEQNFSEADIGNNPIVNLGNGRLKYVFEDVSIGHGNFSIGISHIYSSMLNSKFAAKCQDVGAGWKLNVQQMLIADHVTPTGENVVKYLDAVGEIHRFVQFDGNRYFDDRNAKTVLYYSDTEKYIVDGVGNKLQFNSNGYLEKSISCENPKVVKIFEYNSVGQLKRIYDSRTKNNVNNVKNYIKFDYNTAGLLVSVTTISQFAKKQKEIVYTYGVNNELLSVSKVIYDKNNDISTQKTILEFEYSGGLLSRVINLEDKTSFAFEYHNQYNRIAKVQSDIWVDNRVALGATDSESNQIANMGNLPCGLWTKNNFVNKSFKTYAYHDLDEYNSLSYQTDVTNEKGITIAYFISREARIVSSFEKDSSGNLKTLSKQGAKTPYSASGNDSQQINGRASCTISGGKFERTILQNQSIARNKLEEKCANFSYSFWLKTTKGYKRLMLWADITSLHDDTPQKIPVWIDETAENAWQLVSIPFALKNNDGEPDPAGLKSFSVQFWADGQPCRDTFLINEVGFAPSPITELFLAAKTLAYLPLKLAEKVYINNHETVANNQQSTTTYFAENDIIATFINKYAHQYTENGVVYYDAICNDGRKRIAKVNKLQFEITGFLSDETSSLPFAVETITPFDPTVISSFYSFSSTQMTIQNVASGKDSMTKTIVDYKGKTIEETDEYQVSKKYTYDSFGDLISVQLVDGNNNECCRTSYSYDNERRLIRSDNGINGQKIEYNEYENPSKLTETYFSQGAVVATTNVLSNQYDEYQDKIVSAKEKSDDVSETLTNDVAYLDGKIRTVEDAFVKYGAKYNLADDTVDYTQFEEGKEITLQRDSVFSRSDKGEQHSSQFFDGSGNETAQVATKLDKYGKVLNIESEVGNISKTASYQYDVGSESRFAAKPCSVVDGFSQRSTTFNYDDDGNLVGWTESSNDDPNLKFSVQKISECATKYNFGNRTEYFTEITNDDEKVFSPRVKGVGLKSDTHSDGDNPERLDSVTYDYDNFGRFTRCGRVSYEYQNKEKNYVLASEKGQFFKNSNSGNLVSHYNLSYCYDSRGLITKITQESPADNGKSESQLFKQPIQTTLQYDNLHRITHEINSEWGINNTYEYQSGRLKHIKDKNNVSQTLTYNNKGHLIGKGDTTYTCDDYGNRVSKTNKSATVSESYTYTGGDKLSTICNGKNISYRYNAEGVRCFKQVGESTSEFFLDGAKIVGEDRLWAPNSIGYRFSEKIRYFYDTTGLKWMIYNDKLYKYQCDTMGNVVLILDKDACVVARYSYDIWGNCKIFDKDNNPITEDYHIGVINPFRWKGFYYDTESGLYYANGSYYDPETGSYLDASPISTVFENAFTPRRLDRNGIMCDNVLELAGNPFTIDTATELAPDPNYDGTIPTNWLQSVARWFGNLAVVKWYQGLSNGGKAAVGCVLFALSLVLAFVTGGMSAAIQVTVEVAIGVGVGIGVWALSALATGQQLTWDGLATAALDSFVISSLFAFVQQSVNAIKYVARRSNLTSIGEVERYIDDVRIEKAKRGDFTQEAWERVQSLEHRADGSTISSPPDGTFIHKGYRTDMINCGKETRMIYGKGKADLIVGKTIYELKPNNIASIKRGIKQLQRYNLGMGGGYNLVLVLY